MIRFSLFLVVLFAASFAALSLTFNSQTARGAVAECKAESSADKVTVCHKGRTINIERAALSAHLAHGDTEGACQ